MIAKHLKLIYLDGILTSAISRILTVTITNIEVPPSGVSVTLSLVTNRDDPDRPIPSSKIYGL